MTDISDWIRRVGVALLQKKWLLTTAESCTGGLIAASCTEIAGSSGWFERGFVTYSNASKAEMLGIDPDLIGTYGAVSEPVALAMAQGALRYSKAHIALSVTGIAGPGGATADKPVGTVWLGWATDHQHWSECCYFQGNRQQIRLQTVAHSLQKLLVLINDNSFYTTTGDNNVKKP